MTEQNQPLKDFTDLFQKHIFKRAVQYYNEGNVQDVEEIAPDLWHGVVSGNDAYDVDVRIHNGQVISAACSCPYGQEHTYCKHVGAVLLTINRELNQQNNVQESKAPHAASYAVSWYWSNLVGITDLQRRRFNDDDWRAVQHLLEKLYGFPDFVAYIKNVMLRRMTKQPESYETHAYVPIPTRFDELQHGWLTILEAAYEHLDDTEGLRRLYMLYILLATTKRDAMYVQRLRELSGEHWQNDLATLLEIVRQCGMRFRSFDNPAYERLLREEHLVDAANEYAGRDLGSDRMLRLLPLVAQNNPEQLLELLVKYFRQPDCCIYQGDPYTSAKNVAEWIREIDRVFGTAAARDLTKWILTMFPNRTVLHDKLQEYTDD